MGKNYWFRERMARWSRASGDLITHMKDCEECRKGKDCQQKKDLIERAKQIREGKR